MKISPYEEGLKVKDKQTIPVSDDKLTLAGRTKTSYLGMAVGDREKEEKDKRDPDYKCEACANRKYQDGSDEMVSFKSATHISPEAAATAVRAHEGEHVSNAYDKAEKNDGKVLRASVAIHTSICPECGRTYVSGGTTTTSIRYNNDEYSKNAKEQDATFVPGKDVDALA